MAAKINLELRKQTWFYSFTLDGKRHRGTTGIQESNPTGEHRDKGKALMVAEKVYRQVARGRERFVAELATAADLFERYITRKVTDGLNPSTERNYRNYVGKFFDFFPPDIKLSILTGDDVEEFKAFLLTIPVKSAQHGYKTTGKTLIPKLANRQAKRDAQKTEKLLSPKTVKEILVFIAAVCNFHNLDNPLKNVKMPEKTKLQNQETLKYYSKAEMRSLLSAAREHNRELYWWIVFIVKTGVRLGEAQGIKEPNINFDAGTVFVISEKRNEGRTLSLAPIKVEETRDEDGDLISDESLISPHQSPLFALSVLLHYAKGHYGEEWSTDKPLFYRYKNWFNERLQTVTKLAGIPYRSAHALRHTFITLGLAQGFKLEELAKVAGHKRISTTFETYAHLSADVKINISLED